MPELLSFSFLPGFHSSRGADAWEPGELLGLGFFFKLKGDVS